LEYVVGRLKQHAGRLPVEMLAREANPLTTPARTRFLQHVGVGPKRLADVFRFNVTYRLMRGTAGYARLLQDYDFDQSHFLKAFKRYAGITPCVYSQVRDTVTLHP
jgi:AraC-like DNA-binding protein